MPRNSILLLIVIAFFILLYQNINSDNSLILNEQINEKAKDNTLQKEDKRLNKAPKNQKFTKLELTQAYSHNPHINQTIVIGLYQDCVPLFELHKNNKLKKQHFNKYKQTHFKEKVLDRFAECKKVNIEHPEYHLNNESEFINLRKNNSIDTVLSQILTQEINLGHEKNIDQQFLQEFKQASPYLLLTYESTSAIRNYHALYSMKPIMEIVQSQQLSYLRNLIQNSQMYYNCEVNNGCIQYDYHLANLCDYDNQYCDLTDFRDYINKRFSPGYIADLKLVVTYIEGILSFN